MIVSTRSGAIPSSSTASATYPPPNVSMNASTWPSETSRMRSATPSP